MDKININKELKRLEEKKYEDYD